MQKPILEESKKIIVTCPTCGIEHSTWKKRPSKYCSADCWYNRTLKDPKYTRVKTPKPCSICGKPFISSRPGIHAKSIYCSYHCHQIGEGRKGGKVVGDAKFGTGTSGWYLKRCGRHIHRTIMEEHIGRRLLSSEIVHHIDGNAHNNSIENLKLMSRAEHMSLHRASITEGKRKYNGL